MGIRSVTGSETRIRGIARACLGCRGRRGARSRGGLAGSLGRRQGKHLGVSDEAAREAERHVAEFLLMETCVHGVPGTPAVAASVIGSFEHRSLERRSEKLEALDTREIQERCLVLDRDDGDICHCSALDGGLGRRGPRTGGAASDQGRQGQREAPAPS